MSDEIFNAYKEGVIAGKEHSKPSKQTLEHIQELARVSLEHIKQDKEVMRNIIESIEKNNKALDKILFWSRFPAIFLFCFLVLVVIGTILDN